MKNLDEKHQELLRVVIADEFNKIPQDAAKPHLLESKKVAVDVAISKFLKEHPQFDDGKAFVHPDGGGDHSPAYYACVASHGGQCGSCSEAGGWTPCG